MKSKVFERILEKTQEDIKSEIDNFSKIFLYDRNNYETLNKKSKSIYLIEKGFIDSMENRNVDWYEPFGYKLSEQEAKEFCDSFGFWTDKDCWSIAYLTDKKMMKYRYKEINLI